MNAEQVIEKILSEARQEAESILSEAKAKSDQQQAAQEAELKAYQEKTEQLAKQAADDKRLRMLAAARMDLQKQMLTAKVALLDELFESACRKINELPDGAYRDLMVRLMSTAVQTGDEEVVVGKNETRIDMSLLKKANQQLGPGFRGNLRLSDERADLDGGFLLRRGRVQINASTEVLIGQVREDMESELSEQLFAE